MRFSTLLLALPLTFQFAHADQPGVADSPSTTETIEQKILAQGVPADAYKMLVDYMKEHHDRESIAEVYGCPTYVKVETKDMIPAPVPKATAKDAKAGDKKDAPKVTATSASATKESPKTAVVAAPAKDAAPVADKDAKTIETKVTDTKAADTKTTDAKEVKKDAPKMIEHIKVSYKAVPPTGPTPTLRPCDESVRVKFTKKVTFSNPTNVAIIDFSQPSTARRFFLINLQTGKVDRYYTAHGKGSGNTSAYATKFSNQPDSLQTSLGFYITGETYVGGEGETMRLYGLDRSDDQAYNRDVVMHGAWYVGEDFMKSINEQTKKPYGRLGVSWGCPAISQSLAPKIISQLKGGSVLLHYYPGDLMEKALTGRQVVAPAPVVVFAPPPAVPVPSVVVTPTAPPTADPQATAAPETATTSSTNSQQSHTQSNSPAVAASN